jgi:hypothetical protein
MLTLCWNRYDVYACVPGRVTILDSDGAGPALEYMLIGCVWILVVVPYPIG